MAAIAETALDPTSERRVLQAAIAIGALLPVGAGLSGIVLGLDLTGEPGSVSTDSHFRYLSGLLLGIGLAFWSTVPAIERRTGRVRILTAIVFVGGLGRLLALATVGVPSAPMLAGLVMELGVTPLLCLWQARVARLHGRN